jgi:hypothetical protein
MYSLIYARTRVRFPPHPLNERYNMSFWKKVLKKFKKQQDHDPKGLIEDKYFHKLQKKLDKLEDQPKKKKK